MVSIYIESDKIKGNYYYENLHVVNENKEKKMKCIHKTERIT